MLSFLIPNNYSFLYPMLYYWVWLFLKRTSKLHKDWSPWDLDHPLPLNIKPEKLAFILEAIRNHPRTVADLYTGAGLYWLERAVKFSGILQSGWRHIGSLKSATVGVFIPQKLTTATNQAFLHPIPREPVVKYKPIHHWYQAISLVINLHEKICP